MWKFAALILMLQIFGSASAQHSVHNFHGTVLDKETLRPVANVNFKVEGRNAGTVSDHAGAFSFSLDSVPALLTVSHIGYQTKKIILDERTGKMTLYLIPVATQLKEIVISATPFEIVFKDKKYSILDYEVDSGYLYLLVYKNRFSKSELICRTTDGDTVAGTGLLDFSPQSLFRDCMGCLHILSADSAYQLYRDGESILFFPPFDIKKFRAVLNDCITSTPEYLYFRKTTDLGLGAEFFSIDRESRKQKWIARVKDEEKMKMLSKNPGDAWMLMSAVQPDQEGTNMAEDVGAVMQTRDDFEKWNWVRRVLYLPLKSFLYRIGDFICIFNIPEKQMEFYDLDGNFSYIIELATEQVTEGRWSYDILIDDITRKVFTTYTKNGMVNLFEIDLNTGALAKKVTTFYPFPRKLTVYDESLYYLYDDPTAPDNKMLFRQRL